MLGEVDFIIYLRVLYAITRNNNYLHNYYVTNVDVSSNTTSLYHTLVLCITLVNIIKKYVGYYIKRQRNTVKHIFTRNKLRDWYGSRSNMLKNLKLF